ncbi:hypothetical protein SYJ56_02625 [Algoriphagus sp. D3-2-R+10]|uniref:hypothetical protein n=1 Tax=Algoriphagus aurantiacus TaxID=3103948 RepID=UPI002B38E3F1|nr:hypothetical protein [Algoriphagus sp. D3-2-R+10]MEB2774181.1 hypothetical protein [Algoriphagus sp. D3-2-R+10]
MISLLRNLPAGQAEIRQKLLQGNKIGSYLKYAIGEILLVVFGSNSPFRGLIWVEQTISQTPSVPLGTGYVGNPTVLAYRQAGLRHARQIFDIFFYRYFVQMGYERGNQ